MTREEAINNLNMISVAFVEAETKEQRKIIDDTFNMAIKALEKEPKTGHWIMTNDYLTTAYGSVDYVKCSCCGEDSLEEGDFCPNCGAKMKVGDA